MRLAIFSSSYPRSADDSRSAGVFVADFAGRVAAREGGCVVVTPQRVDPAPGRVTVRRIPWPGGDTSLTHMKGWGARVRMAIMMIGGIPVSIRAARKSDHVLAMWAVPSGIFAWLAWRIARVPYSVWALGSDIWRIDDYPFGRRILRRVLRDARYVYANSTDLRDAVRRVLPRPVEVLPTSRILPPPAGTPLLDAFEPGATNFVTVARFHPNKGIDILLEAIASIPAAERSKMRFHVFGGGPEEGDIRRLIGERHLGDSVRLGGYVGPAELSALLDRADCLVIPSRIESLPVLLGDAIQRGCPVIATDVGDLGALVREHGVGSVVAPGAVEDLAHAIRSFEGRDAASLADGMSGLASFLSLDRSVDQVLSNVSEPAP